MGWLWGSDDPLKDLDPSLRNYLEKQAPDTYKATHNTGEPKQPEAPPKDFRSQIGLSLGAGPNETTPAKEHAPDQEDRPLPKQSLFQDGRYAHLWKTYRPYEEAEEAAKSDAEKLTDLLAGYKDRQNSVKQAAMENCADEQWNVHECFRTGGWKARATMCREENKALQGCIGMQTKFLRALGYLSPYTRSDEETERIQMHADTLYHRMLNQERQIKEAKENGLPVPQFKPLIRQRQEGEPDTEPLDDPYEVRPTIKKKLTWDSFPPQLKDEMEKTRLKDLEGPQLELARHELTQELATKEAMLRELEKRQLDDHRDRLARLEAGRERMSDKIKRWFDLRDWDKIERLEAEKAAAAANERQQRQ